MAEVLQSQGSFAKIGSDSSLTGTVESVTSASTGRPRWDPATSWSAPFVLPGMLRAAVRGLVLLPFVALGLAFLVSGLLPILIVGLALLLLGLAPFLVVGLGFLATEAAGLPRDDLVRGEQSRN